MPKPKDVSAADVFGALPSPDEEGEGDSFDALAETVLGSGDMATRKDALRQAIKLCMAEGDDEAAEGEAGGY